jgi:endonuclease YncB( thermonuclease family)
MKTHLKIRHLVFSALLVPALSGCGNILSVPEPAVVPTPATKPTRPVFNATDYITPGNKRPGVFRVQNVISGDTLAIQSVAIDAKTGKATPNSVVQTVRLAGIVSPQPGQPGWQGAVKTVQNWTILNPRTQTVEVEDDSRFPFDEDRNANVQVYFNGTSEATASTRYNLNRMMVRSGWALVDLHTPTSIELQQWLNDQQYAQQARLGLWKQQNTLGWVYKALLVPRPRATRAGGRTGRTSVISTTAEGRLRTTQVGPGGPTSTTVGPGAGRSTAPPAPPAASGSPAVR